MNTIPKRSAYLSLPAFIVPVIASFITGLLTGWTIAGLLYTLFPPVIVRQTAQTIGSISALIAFWLVWYGWWYKAEQEERQHRRMMDIASKPFYKYYYPQTPPHIQRTNGGHKQSALDCPANYGQSRFIAEMAVKRGKNAISIRKLNRAMTPEEASDYIGWLIGEGYAVERNPNNAKSGVEITRDGMDYFNKLLDGPSTNRYLSPTGDGWTPLERDFTPAHTQDDN